MEKDVLSAKEAMLLFTEIKMEMAGKFRQGISYEDFVEFEKRLELIDRALLSESNKIKENLNARKVG